MNPLSVDQSVEFEQAAQTLLERFDRLWKVRDSELVREIVADDAVSYWSGLGAIPGSDYPGRWHALVNESGAEVEFEVTGHAAQDPYLFISWHVRVTLGENSVEYDGIDRFRVRGQLADQVYVVFDSAPMTQLFGAAGGDAAARVG
jgi:hypothetical protein